MFDSANLEHTVSKELYHREEPKLRAALLKAQYDLLQDGRFPVLMLIAGVEGAGKGEMVNLLNAWMDPRHIHTRAFFDTSDEERERPPLWRCWRALPPKGRIGIFFGAWHTQPIIERVQGLIGESELARQTGEIVRLEKMLCDEGVLLLKYWFHLSREQQKKRFKALEKDPASRWRVTDLEWKYFDLYKKFVGVCDPFLRQTSTGEAPWIVVPGYDPHYRALTVGRHLLAAMRERLDRKPDGKAPPKRATPLPKPAGRNNLIRALKLDQELSKHTYQKQLEKWQGRLNLLARDPRFKEIAVVTVFEGNDAAGKGGAIRRVTGALDARWYSNVPVAAPTEEERAQPYLWRFWRHIPGRRRFVFFDRSWYGRVLVERVEGYCSEAEWMRAYGEINDFEQALTRHHIVMAKFWLAISADEQLRRFKEREAITFKQFKITEEDWRNRDKWGAYERAVCDMVDRTSTPYAPWTLIEANNKYHARIKVLKTLCRAIEKAYDRLDKPGKK